MGRKQKEKTIKPPELPPDLPDDEVEVSDEDVQFVARNLDYAKFVKRLDTASITKHVARVADSEGDNLEKLHEKKLKKKSLEKEEGDKGIEVDPVDALPIKTLDGELHYRTVPKGSKKEDEVEQNQVDDGGDKGIVKLTKAERRAKLKKSKKEAKKHAKEDVDREEVQPLPQQAEVLAEVKEDLTAEEVAENKKRKIAELGTTLLSAPESNIKSLVDLLQFCKDKDSGIVKLGLLSCLAVFRDLIPGYRIRLPTEKEAQMTVSKSVKKMRYYESTLLNSYKVYLQRLIALERQPKFHQVAVRCLCTLLDAVPHFNYRESLLPPVVENLGSSDDVVRNLCLTTIRSLFLNPGKHGGEATIEVVRFIAELVKLHECQMYPDMVDVFLSLSFDEDIRKSEEMDKDEKMKNKKNKRKKKSDEETQPVVSENKQSRQELLSKTREEVNADFKIATLAPDFEERKRMQSETLHAIFLTYFRILKHTIHIVRSNSKGNASSSLIGLLGPHPLLASSLKGIGKFAHFIDVDFMADIMKCLKTLASSITNLDGSEAHLTVSERLQCCIVAFQIMRNNLDSLKVDLQEFTVQLYNLILEYRPGRDQGEVLAEALKIMLCDERQHDMQRAAGFIKRLATFSLCFGSAESMAALVTLKHLLQKNVKCRSMLENDPGGGSVAGTIARYQPDASDPHLSGALSSVLWELSLLAKHYHPAISAMASALSTMTTTHNQKYVPITSPQQALADMSLEKEAFSEKIDMKKLNNKRKRGNDSSLPAAVGSTLDGAGVADEDKLKKKLNDHFRIVRDISENERLRRELDRTNLSLRLYEEYKIQRKVNQLESKNKKKKRKRKV